MDQFSEEDVYLLEYDPRNCFPSNDVLAQVNGITLRLQDKYYDPKFQHMHDQLRDKLTLLTQWSDMVCKNLDFQIGPDGLHYLDRFAMDRTWVPQTRNAEGLAVQRTPDDPYSVQMKKLHFCPTSGCHFLFAKTLAKAIYGSIKVAVPCEIGPDGVYHPNTANSVIVKCYKKREADLREKDGKKLLEDAYKEITVLKYLSSPGHPFVQSFISCACDDQKVYLYQEKASHAMQVFYQHPHDIRQLRHVFYQMVSALDYVHNCGIAHRDVSLENYLYFGDSNTVKIIDFGLCKPMTMNSDKTGWNLIKYDAQVGKFPYMAPEVFSPNDIVRAQGYCGVRADIWSLGICWYLLLTQQFLCNYPNDENFKYFVQSGGCGENVLNHVILRTNSVSDIDKLLCKRAVEILNRMLVVDFSSRISLMGILNHPLFEV